MFYDIVPHIKIFDLMFYIPVNNFSVMAVSWLDMRKPVSRGWPTKMLQTSLCIRAVVIHLLERTIIYIDLLQAKFRFSKLISVAEQAGLKLTLSETMETGFVASLPIVKNINVSCSRPQVRLQLATPPSQLTHLHS